MAKWGLIVNPAAGKSTYSQKLRLVSKLKPIFKDVEVAGLHSESPEELIDQAKSLSERIKNLVIMGGDGTRYDIMNNINPEVPLAILPAGSGNMLKYVFKLPKSLIKTAQNIVRGTKQKINMIEVNNSSICFSAGVGFVGHVLENREDYLSKGYKGFTAYLLAALKSGLWDKYERQDVELNINGKIRIIPHSLEIILGTIPNWGYNMNVLPGTNPYGNSITIKALNHSVPRVISGGIRALLPGGTHLGHVYEGTNITITTEKPSYSQISGQIDTQRTVNTYKFLKNARTFIY